MPFIMTLFISIIIEIYSHVRIVIISGDMNSMPGPFISCIETKREHVAMAMLALPECDVNEVDGGGTHAIHIACHRQLTDLVLAMLERPECRYDVVNKCKETPLMIACMKKMEDVALKMLEDPTRCKIDAYDRYGNTAMSIAKKNGLTRVYARLLQTTDIQEELDLDKDQMNTFHDYMAVKMNQMIDELPDDDELKDRIKKIDEIETRMSSVMSKGREGRCTICYEDTDKNTVYVKCKHIMLMCSECASHMNKECPICRTRSDMITGGFLV